MINLDEETKQNAKQLDHRYDGRLKVTGAAKYAAEFPVKDVVHGYIVQSTIPSGTVASIDDAAARHASGVLAVMTPFSAPKVTPNNNVNVLQDNRVLYNGQPIAVVVARSLPEAIHAATLLRVNYNPTPARLDFDALISESRPPKRNGVAWEPGTSPLPPGANRRGDVDAAFAKAAVTVDQIYTTPIQNHNPMEPHATIASWENGKLSVYDSTQGITGERQNLAHAFGLQPNDVHVECPFVGGGFGCKGSVWSHVLLAAMAAKVVQRPVKIAITREQMFGPVGSRPNTRQHIKLGADATGKLLATQHDVTLYASMFADFVEGSANQTNMLYASETLSTNHRLVEMNLGMGTFQRAPGEATGTLAFEVALDELAEKLNMDPIQLRLANYAEEDPGKKLPWSSKHLRECYADAAERFNWARRKPTPGQVREGNKLIGFGMATATYGANRSNSTAIVRILPSGRVYVGCGTQDLGTGTYTIMAQAAAMALGVDPSLVDVELGDSTLPRSGGSGGSQTAASVCPAVYQAALDVKQKLINLACNDSASPLHLANTESVSTRDGVLFTKSFPTKSEPFAALLSRSGTPIEATATAEPAKDRSTFSSHSWGAVFAEVAVDADTRTVQVRRVVGTYDIGTLMNRKTGINQLQGGIAWGIGFALHEEAHIDPTHGLTVNRNIAEYHVPVNADVGEIDVACLNIPDYRFSPLGARGIGEIGITGAAAAVANAVYNATGKRVRDFPITIDKLMA
ncbi:xanthine dehydrogenase family protein molybdopterin-binding subunit [Edaphobacter aggregans]|uniref:xanthine dehydrogenase family protein molybdopterin-binding subunit n=1 Tax=Edaphobacter aggregans TaxID=570835 RepID=UPI0005560668|nr:xanthine dehydrogenase family protein molybdopterin-binding subunit [Edaphobacter aggregans]